MSTVTALRSTRRDRGQVNIYLDGRLAFTVEAETVKQQGLHPGQELTPDELAALARWHRHTQCYNAALRLLSYRPRSEAELRQRLARRGFEPEGIEASLERLRRQGLVDDEAFARFWQENRDSFSPRSSWLTRQELHRKGVPAEVIARLPEGDDDASAYRAAVPRARRLAGYDYRTFYRRLGSYLKRRGFTYGTIDRTVKQIWQEQTKQPEG